jgi:hypothetical protein
MEFTLFRLKARDETGDYGSRSNELLGVTAETDIGLITFRASTKPHPAEKRTMAHPVLSLRL